MPQRTIAPGGGNWNSTATWVEGAIPTSSDYVVGLATSGQLTMNVAATCQYVDFTDYANTLTFNNFLQTSLASATNTFGASMNFAGTSEYQFYNAPGTIVQNTTNRIPALATANNTKTLNTNVYCTNFRLGGTIAHNGNTIFIYGNVASGFATFNGTTNIEMVGSGIIEMLNWNAGEFIINTTGTYTINNRIGLGNNNSNKNVSFRHSQGTIINPSFAQSLNYGTSITTLNLISGTTWNFVGSTSQVGNLNLTFAGDCYFNNFTLCSLGQVSASALNYIISGANLSINNFSTIIGINTPVGVFNPSAFAISLNPSYTYTINNSFDVNGSLKIGNNSFNPQIEIRSNVVSTPVSLIMNTYNQYVSRVRFTDVDCSGGDTLYGQELTLTRTTNITQYTLPPSSGGGETSSVFIS